MAQICSCWPGGKHPSPTRVPFTFGGGKVVIATDDLASARAAFP